MPYKIADYLFYPSRSSHRIYVAPRREDDSSHLHHNPVAPRREDDDDEDVDVWPTNLSMEFSENQPSKFYVWNWLKR